MKRLRADTRLSKRRFRQLDKFGGRDGKDSLGLFVVPPLDLPIACNHHFYLRAGGNYE